jgi:hypothetical protein
MRDGIEEIDTVDSEPAPGNEPIADGGLPPSKDRGQILYLTALLFVIISSGVFALFFEWGRYQSFFGQNIVLLSIWDQIEIVSILWAKSIVLLASILWVFWMFVRRGSWLVAMVLLLAGWTCLFYWLAVDLLVLNVTGRHLSHWLPYLFDMITATEKNPIQVDWISGWSIARNASIALLATTATGLAFFVALRWLASRLVRRFPWVVSGNNVRLVTVAFFVAVFGSTYLLALLGKPFVLHQIYPALPLVPDALSLFSSGTREIIPSSWGLKGASSGTSEAAFRKEVDKEVQQIYQRSRASVTEPKEVDLSAYIRKPSLPNVILIVLESFRYSAVEQSLMKRLDKWSESGLRLDRHYSGSNCSHLGLFTLLYGRTALNYEQTIAKGIPPQICESLRKSGYWCSYVSSVEHRGFRMMGGFINDKTFDTVVMETRPQWGDWRDWPDADRRVFDRVRQIIADGGATPQFVVAFLMSTHYPYAFPPEFETYKPSNVETFVKNWKLVFPDQLFNRYKNSALFLEDELMKFVENLDLKRNMVIITGDHGESMTEDGWISHATRASEIQTRVPFIMVGPGISPRKVTTATSHSDFLPTLLHYLAGQHVPVRHSHGRDLVSTESPPDETALVPSTFFGPHELVLIRDNKRLLFKLWPDRDIAETVGFLDTNGRIEIDSGEGLKEREAEKWIAFFNKELTKYQ